MAKREGSSHTHTSHTRITSLFLLAIYILRHRIMSSSKRSYAIASALALVAVCIIVIFVASSNNDTPIGSNLYRHLTESSSSSSLLDENQALPPLFPLTWPSDYLGFTCATLGLLLAAGGGIGK